jgi:hypothetical protein
VEGPVQRNAEVKSSGFSVFSWKMLFCMYICTYKCSRQGTWLECRYLHKWLYRTSLGNTQIIQRHRLFLLYVNEIHKHS